MLTISYARSILFLFRFSDLALMSEGHWPFFYFRASCENSRYSVVWANMLMESTAWQMECHFTSVQWRSLEMRRLEWNGERVYNWCVAWWVVDITDISNHHLPLLVWTLVCWPGLLCSAGRYLSLMQVILEYLRIMDIYPSIWRSRYGFHCRCDLQGGNESLCCHLQRIQQQW